MNPGWLVHTWREWDLPGLRNQLWFDAAAHPAQRADIARFELLHRFGGIYVDTDFAPLRPIEALVADTEMLHRRRRQAMALARQSSDPVRDIHSLRRSWTASARRSCRSPEQSRMNRRDRNT